jgi:hypothetical protein
MLSLASGTVGVVLVRTAWGAVTSFTRAVRYATRCAGADGDDLADAGTGNVALGGSECGVDIVAIDGTERRVLGWKEVRGLGTAGVTLGGGNTRGESIGAPRCKDGTGSTTEFTGCKISVSPRTISAILRVVSRSRSSVRAKSRSEFIFSVRAEWGRVIVARQCGHVLLQRTLLTIA